MKNNYQPLALFLMLLMAFTSCTTTRITNIKKTYGEILPSKDLDCSKTEPEEVDIFYKRDSTDFKYEKIGYVTAYATHDIADSLILKRLQYNSYLLCGNAVMDVYLTKTIKNGENVNQYNGVSVIIEKDSLYNSKYPFRGDYSFYNFATQDYDNQVEETTAFGYLMIGVGTVGTFILFILNLADEEEYEEGI